MRGQATTGSGRASPARCLRAGAATLARCLRGGLVAALGDCGLALGAVDRGDHAAGVGQPDEGEVAVVGAGSIEVDGAHAQDALHDRLVRVDVLHAVDARLLHALGEDPAADVEPLVGHHVGRPDPAYEADHEHERDQHYADKDADGGAHGQRDDRADQCRADDAPEIEREQRPPRGVAFEDDVLAGVQLHGRNPSAAPGDGGRPDGSRLSEARAGYDRSGMWDAAADVAAVIENAATGLAEAIAGAALGWLALGVVLHVANQLARGRGWYVVVRRACPDDPRLRGRDAVGAWVAGCGVGGVASARGGDAVRILMLSRRLRGTGPALMAGTLVAEGAGETAIGIVLLGTALAAGVGPSVGIDGGSLPWLLGGVALLVAAGALLWRWAPARRVGSGVGRGCAALECPRAYARRVLPWQLTSRLARAAALACFLAAFGLPATPLAVLLVMVAQAGGRLVPLAPASAAASVGMLAASFAPVTGTSVSTSALAAFFVGTSTVLTVVGLALSAALVATTIPAPAPAAQPAPESVT